MPTPTIQGAFPPVGLTAGAQLVEIRGAGFRTRSAAPVAPRPGPLPPSPPTVAVLFGDRPAQRVDVISSTLLRVLTPRHPPSQWVYRFDTGNSVPAPPPNAEPPPLAPDGATYVQATNGTVAITVQNLDDAGQPIPGEAMTQPAGFTFRRPRLDVQGTWEMVMEGVTNELVELVTPNVAFNPSLDFDPETGGLRAVTGLAQLPGIGLLSVSIAPSERMHQGPVEVPLENGLVALKHRPMKHDMRINGTIVSDNPGELLSLTQILSQTIDAGMSVYLSGETPDEEPWRYDVMLVGDIQIPERTGRGELLAATFTLAVYEITSTWMPGAPAEGLMGTPQWVKVDATRGLTRAAKYFDLRATMRTE